MIIQKIGLVFLLLSYAHLARRMQKQPLSTEADHPHGLPNPLKALSMLLLGGHPSALFNAAGAGFSAPVSLPGLAGCHPVMLELSAYEEPPPRVRFAPSPTGVLHVGGARTALFNWLYAKKEGGKFILRFEDTDQERSTQESEDAILEGLKWCGFDWDEGPDIGGDCGPYRQTDALAAGLYQEQLQKLIDEGYVYRCFLTTEELDAMRAEAKEKDEIFKVDSPWSRASEEEIKEMLDKDTPHVWRFRMPEGEPIKWKDVVLGWQRFNSTLLGGDFVIMRSNGLPLYNFAAVVDDDRMGITHVLRAQEHVLNTPKQILIYRALRMATPKFGHMPLILAPDKTKLSKRHGAASVQDFEKMGVLPLSLNNYMMQLGYGMAERGLFPMSEHIANFSGERIRRTNAVFDVKSLTQMNHEVILGWSEAEAMSNIGSELVKAGIVKEASGDFVTKAVPILQLRLELCNEAGPKTHFWVLDYPLKETLESDIAKEFVENGAIAETAKLLREYQEEGVLEKLEAKDQDTIAKGYKALAKKIGKARGAKGKNLFLPIRICLTGVTSGPEIPEIYEILNAVDDNVLVPYKSLNDRLDELDEAVKTSA